MIQILPTRFIAEYSGSWWSETCLVLPCYMLSGETEWWEVQGRQKKCFFMVNLVMVTTTTQWCHQFKLFKGLGNLCVTRLPRKTRVQHGLTLGDIGTQSHLHIPNLLGRMWCTKTVCWAETEIMVYLWQLKLWLNWCQHMLLLFQTQFRRNLEECCLCNPLCWLNSTRLLGHATKMKGVWNRFKFSLPCSQNASFGDLCWLKLCQLSPSWVRDLHCIAPTQLGKPDKSNSLIPVDLGFWLCYCMSNLGLSLCGAPFLNTYESNLLS